MQHHRVTSSWGSIMNRSHDPFQINGVAFVKPVLLTMSISIAQDESELEKALAEEATESKGGHFAKLK